MLENPAHPQRFFVYVADPMCSWCYGFAPVMAALLDRFQGRLGFRLVMGGLRPGETRPLRDKDRHYLRETWQHVAAASGQPFDLAFLERDTFVYDTEPACRAVVAARQHSDHVAFGLMTAISTAFYAENRDVTRPAILADIAAETGFARDAFKNALAEPSIRAATLNDFAFAKQAGIEGFPCLLAGNATQGYQLITHGFRPIDGLEDALETWIASAD